MGDDLATFLGLTEEQKETLRVEIKAAFDAIAEAERQAAINSHKVFIR